MTATVSSERTSVLLPLYGFPGCRDTQPVPGYHSDQFTAGYLIQVLGGARYRDRTMYHVLRDPATPRPEGAYNAIVLTGGRQQYYRGVSHSTRHAPWWYRIANGMRDCYVVWGRQGRDGAKIFDPDRPARTSSGRGSIYTRWPVFDEHGQLTHYGWEVVHVEFTVLDRRPELGDKLKLTVDRRRGQAEIGHSAEHDHLLGYGDDQLWNDLDRRAKAGFDATCTDRLNGDTDKWLTWFLKQRATSRGYEGDQFRETCRSMDWIRAMDHAIEAWQMAIVLSAFSHMFPEVAPNLDLPSDPGLLLKEARGEVTIIRDPGYDGTFGGMEGRLLKAYLDIRPERRDTLDQWMTEYVVLLSGLRNYTGD